MWVLPLFGTLISAFYGGIVFGYYRKRRAPAHLAWSLALQAVAFSSAVIFLGSAGGWTPLLARIYYLVIAVAIMALFSVGTAYLLAPRVIAHIWLILVVATIAISAYAISIAAVDNNVLASASEPGWNAIEITELVLGLASALNSLGTLILALGAVVAYVYKRFAAANIMIAAGAIVLYYGSNLIKELGSYELISLGQILGASIIFAGISLTRSASRDFPKSLTD